MKSIDTEMVEMDPEVNEKFQEFLDVLYKKQQLVWFTMLLASEDGKLGAMINPAMEDILKEYDWMQECGGTVQ
jgi:hypothetical protein